MNSSKKALEWIENHRGEILSGFKELVRIPSLTGEEGEAQEYMKKLFLDLGLEVKCWEPDCQELFSAFPEVAQYPTCWQPELDLPLKFEDVCTYQQLINSPYREQLTYRGRPNVVGVLKGTGGGRSLILNGHIDVVTIGDESGWEHGPFEAYEEKGRIYGRGTSDMKGGIWAMTKALEGLIRSGVRLKGDVILQSVVNEEHAGNGSLSCVAMGYKADGALVCEPTGSVCFSRTSGGGIYWEIKLKGKEAHAGSRWKNGKANGISAIEKVPLILSALLRKEAEENREEIKLSLGIGVIRGGEYATSTARQCTISGVVYFSSAFGTGVEGLRKIKTMFKEAVKEAASGDDWLSENPPEVAYLHYDDAYQYPESSPFLDVLRESGRAVLGKELGEISFSACDARHLGNRAETPTIIYGPGDLSLAHSLNESIEGEEIIQAAKVMAQLICGWCGIDNK